MAFWHALAKLRLHTTTTLALLRSQTATLARRLRQFQSKIASCYKAVETNREHEARKRREVRRGLATGSISETAESEKRGAKFSLVTYKLHALGGYAEAVELFGTTDSYSTQIVSSSFSGDDFD